MKKKSIPAAVLLLCNLVMAATAQELKNMLPAKAKSRSETRSVFDGDSVLELRLSGDVRGLLSDRGDNPIYHAIKVTYKAMDSSEVSVPVQARARGHFRKMKENCLYPPLLLHFSKDNAVQPNIFKENYKLKLAMPCRGGDQYIVHEWLVYKLYNLITPNSFRARLVSVKLEDDKDRKSALPFYGMLLEEEQQVAERNGAVPVSRKLRPEQVETNSFLTMAVFQYMIGNTDWSVQFMQNIKLLSKDSTATPVPVPYDFDMSGLVGSPYAKPAEELNMVSVRQRRYRGYCLGDMKKFDEVVALYNRLKKDIYGIYASCPLVDAKYIKSTLKFFDEFYETINNAGALKKEFEYPCDKNGTGNVVIRGLREE